MDFNYRFLYFYKYVASCSFHHVDIIIALITYKIKVVIRFPILYQNLE